MPGRASDQPSTLLAESSCTRTTTNPGGGSGECTGWSTGAEGSHPVSEPPNLMKEQNEGACA